MTIREWLQEHPDVIIEDNLIGEGYGDGWIKLEDCLDDEIRNVYFDEKTRVAEIYI